MYHIDISKKRTQLALRFFSYGVMAVATAVLSVLAIYYALGFRFNRNLTIEQGGIVQFRSAPEGARVLTDGKKRDNTPSYAYLSAGDHEVQMQLNGYRSWQKRISLMPGQLLWLDYIRFIPNQIDTQIVKQLSNLDDSLFSPDKRWLAIFEDTKTPTLTLVDIADEKSPNFKTIDIPVQLLTKKDDKIGNLSLLEWSLDSRYLLLRHHNGDINEVVRIDRDKPEETVNLSKDFRLDIGQLHFSGTNPNIVYALTGDVLRKLDIGAGSASAALVTDVITFTLYGSDDIAFVAERELNPGSARQQVVGIYKAGKESVVRNFELGRPILVDLTEYFRHSYLAISYGDEQVEIIKNPGQATGTSVKLTMSEPADWMEFSNHGRILVAGAKKTWFSYDLELALSHQTQETNQLNGPLKWLDDFHLYSEGKGKLAIFEFDGQNRNEIVDVAEGFAAGLSANGRSLFSFNRNQDKTELQVSRLVVEN